MNAKKHLIPGIAALAAVALAASAARAAETNETFRTTGYFVGVTQGTNAVTDKPIIENFSFAGHNLVNLAMGRSVDDTNFPGQVMAMTFACDMSSANLVVFDRATTNVVATIAASTAVDSVKAQDLNQAGPNRARFVAMLQVAANGNGTNGLAGGYFTVAGRIHLSPVTGCPEPVLVILDRDPLDRVVDDVELPASLDPDDVALVVRTGLAHLIGVVDVINDGRSHTVLVPYGGLSIRRELPDEAASVAVPN